MPDNKNKQLSATLKKQITATLEPERFVRKGNTWCRSNRETVLVIDLQKSNYSDLFYINLGTLLKDTTVPDTVKFVPEHKCDIRDRLCSHVGKSLENMLNFDHPASDEARLLSIKQAIVEIGLPLLKRCQTIAECKQEYAKPAPAKPKSKKNRGATGASEV